MTNLENDKLWDSYFYPGTDVLKNNFGYKNYEELKKHEVSITFDKLLELNENPLKFEFSQEYLKKIHRYVFEDIYPFAGEYRKVNMKKRWVLFYQFITKIQ